MAPKTVEELRQRLVSDPVGLLARQRRLRAAHGLAARLDTSEAARALAHALASATSWERAMPLVNVAGDIDDEVAAIARTALGSLTAPDALDAVCAVWAETRSPALAELVVANGWVASSPAELRVLSALKAGRAPRVGVLDVAPLVDALTDGDPDVAMGAAQALSGIYDPAAARALATVVAERGHGLGYDALGALKKQPAIDAVCAVWAKTRSPAVAELMVANGWVASGPAELRVLSALKAGRAAEPGPGEVAPVVAATADADPDIAEGARQSYEELDFDQGLLRGAYEAAGPSLRDRLATRAREAGRRDWVSVVAGGRRAVAAMSEREWEAALSVLEGAGRGEDLWRLATEAPPCFGARMLRALDHMGWAPPAEADRPGFHALVALAAACGDRPPALGGPLTPLATLEGHIKLVYCLAVTPDGSVLASGGSDCTVRLWRLPDGAPLATLKGHTDVVRSPAITLDGSVLASRGGNGTVRLREGYIRAWATAPTATTPLEEVEAALSVARSERERCWLELIVGLARWRRRFEVEVGDAVVHAGEFDIELGA